MNLLKQNREYYLDQVKGHISNNFKFTIKDLYKKDTHKLQSCVYMLDCEDCGMYLSCDDCLYCGSLYDEGIDGKVVKNMSTQRPVVVEEKSIQCMILMVDLSGSMNITYPSTYQKINKGFVERALGPKNFEVLRKAIGEEEIVKNFKSIQTLLQSGQLVRDIALSFRQELNHEKKKGKPIQKKIQKIQYISRKQIIQIGVAQYIQTIQHRRPNTIITVVYFNTNIEYPINDFAECKVVGSIADKTLEDMIEAGKHAAAEISLSSISDVGDRLLTNMTKAEADGQTAMTPALAFCLGMSQQWKHDLHQIVIVTDGLSNVGFGQTEQAAQLEQSKKIYEHLATKYAVKSNSVVNIISFEDCSIGYDVIDEIVKWTGGVPYSIGFKENAQKQKTVSFETIAFLNYEMTTGFCESTKQFCFDNKMVIKASDPDVKIRVPEQLQLFFKINKGNWISLDLGVRSINEPFEFGFYLEPDYKLEKQLQFKLTVQHQYRRTKKVSFIVREEMITIKPGDQKDTVESEAKVLRYQIEQRLRKKFDEDNYEDYESLSKKMEKIEVVEKIDHGILEKFQKKKAFMESYDKNVDQLNKDKRAIQSRRKQTYNRRKYSEEEDIFAC